MVLLHYLAITEKDGSSLLPYVPTFRSVCLTWSATVVLPHAAYAYKAYALLLAGP